MNETLEFLVRCGSTVVFAAVFAEQTDVPLPAVPWWLARIDLVLSGTLPCLPGTGLGGSLNADLLQPKAAPHIPL